MDIRLLKLHEAYGKHNPGNQLVIARVNAGLGDRDISRCSCGIFFCTDRSKPEVACFSLMALRKIRPDLETEIMFHVRHISDEAHKYSGYTSSVDGLRDGCIKFIKKVGDRDGPSAG